MKAHLISLIILFLAAAGCAQTTQSTPGALLERYQQYHDLVKSHHGETNLADQARPFFSKNLWKEYPATSGASQPVATELYFPLWMSKISHTKESTGTSQGCLMVNGYTDKNEKTALYISYIRENDRWVIDDIALHYLMDNEQYLKEPVCDEEKRQAILFERLQKL